MTMFKAFGAVESIFFRGVGPGGYDIYGVKFANGVAEIRLLLGADGKADDVIFRPDGNDAPGGVVGLFRRTRPESPEAMTAPIKLMIYNGSGRRHPACTGWTPRESARPMARSARTCRRSIADQCRQSMGGHGRVRDNVWRSYCRDSARAIIRSKAPPGQRGRSARRRRARCRRPEAKRCCANTSRPWAAANRTTIA